ncbi:MAG: hypothetical protein GY750_18335 [Lentisphaerae bacterium]|nr:hypothetical protein [Lentisphaerota bacterium]MCP4103356.1 hypothetical protein [Lentisphaerota bacterium]
MAIYKKLPDHGIVPALVHDHMAPALGAFIFIGICSAIMSSMDSLINTGALTMSVDIYKGFLKPKAGKKELMLVSQLSTALVTVLATLIAIKNQSFLEVSWLAADLITTGAFVPLIAGFFWRRGTGAGSVASMITGIVFCTYNLLLTTGINLPVIVEPCSTKAAITGIAFSSIAYFGVSWLTVPDYAKADTFISRAGFIRTTEVEAPLVENN